MANAINPNFSTGVPIPAEPAAPQTKPAPQATTSPAAQTSAPANADRVTLSAGAQAQQLKHSGQTVSQIAVALGVSAATVNSYLGITPTASAAPVTSSPAIAKAAVDGAKLG